MSGLLFNYSGILRVETNKHIYIENSSLNIARGIGHTWIRDTLISLPRSTCHQGFIVLGVTEQVSSLPSTALPELSVKFLLELWFVGLRIDAELSTNKPCEKSWIVLHQDFELSSKAELAIDRAI